MGGQRGEGGPLMPTTHTGVPYLQAHDGVGIGVDDALGHERGADGGCDLRGVEGAFAETRDQRGLADALRAEDHDLGLERGRHDGLS